MPPGADLGGLGAVPPPNFMRIINESLNLSYIFIIYFYFIKYIDHF
jgi:hypothetical protein